MIFDGKLSKDFTVCKKKCWICETMRSAAAHRAIKDPVFKGRSTADSSSEQIGSRELPLNLYGFFRDSFGYIFRYNTERDVLDLNLLREKNEIHHLFPADGRSARAVHHQNGLVHCRGVIKPNLLAAPNGLNGDQLREFAVNNHAGIGITGMVDVVVDLAGGTEE